MKIFILYASAGKGHQTAAEALHKYLTGHYPEHQVRVLNILDYSSAWFAYFYSSGYYFLASYFGFIWSIIYFISSNKFFRKFLGFLSHLNCRKFIDYILTEKPDVVLSTHFFPSEVISYLKQKKNITSKLFTIITDFGVHPYWVEPGTDTYIVASEYTRDQLLARGVSKEKIKVLGIPIRSDFTNRTKKENIELRVLLITGSFGFSFIENIVRNLYRDINLSVVCGNNSRLFNHLSSKKYPNVELFAFTKDMPKIMSEANIIITKPGGLTIAEALAADLPMVLIKGIPGQETENARILVSSGCAIKVSHLSELKNIIIELTKDQNKLNPIIRNIQKMKKPDSTKEICEYVCSSSPRPSG